MGHNVKQGNSVTRDLPPTGSGYFNTLTKLEMRFFDF